VSGADSERTREDELAVDRDHWREQAERVQIDRDKWRTEAEHWRAEAERLASAEQRRLAWRFRQARFRYARQAWGALPVGVRARLKPVVFRTVRHEFVGPEPLERDDSPS
jgi:hypothetical protein